MSESGRKEAFVTLATNDTYSLGCLVLGNSLRKVKTTRQLVVMVTTGVSNPMRTQLAQVFDVIQEVNVLDSNDPINLSLLGRPDLNVTFTKLHCWRLTQFDKAVFLDADTLVLQNVDELFDREELSAAPDAGWPDCFNSGVFVYKPSLETYESLLQFATSQGSFDGGDQGLLNMYFNKWSTEDISKHLPFIYNVVSQAFYSYLPAFTQFKERVKIVHFIGAVKPWHHTYDTNRRTVTPLPGTGHSQEFLQVWWNIFMDTVQPSLDPALIGLVGELATMSIQGSPPPASPVSDAQRKLNWERGQIDYLGQDSFENIQRKIDETLNNADKATATVGIVTPFAAVKSEPKPSQQSQPAKSSVPVKQAAPAPKTESTAPPKVMSTEKPPISEKPSGQTPEAAKPSVPAPESSKPATQAPVSVKSIAQVPVGAKPTVPTPVGVKPTVPAPIGAKPTVPAPVGAKPTVPAPVGAKPTVPAPVGAKPTVPAPVGAKPTVPAPVGAKPTVPAPVGAKPTVPAPVGAKPTVPAPVGAKPTVAAPVGVKPTTPPAVATKPSGPGPLSAKPTASVPGQSRFGAPLKAASAASPAPPTLPRPGAPSTSQSSAKTSSLNIQTSSKKK